MLIHESDLEAPKLRHPILRSLSEIDAERVANGGHIHEYRKVPKSERTDRLHFVCTMMRCECGDEFTL